MQRGGEQTAGGEVVAAVVGAEEMQRALAMQEVAYAGAAAEIFQVRAAAEADVLTMIDQFASGWIAKGAGAAAELAASFK